MTHGEHQIGVVRLSQEEIARGIHQDISVTKNKWVGTTEFFGEFHDFSGAILSDLFPIDDLNPDGRTVTEMVHNHFFSISDHNECLPHSGVAKPLKNVGENRFPANFDHRFWHR